MSPFSSKAFVLGLEAGLVALAGGAVAGLVWTRVSGRPAPVAGVLVVGASAYGLSRVPGLIAPAARSLSPLASLPSGLLAGILALAAAGFLAEFLPGRRLIGALLAVAGAWLIATRAELPEVGWIGGATGLAVVAGGALLAEFDRRWRDTSLAVILLAVTAAGVYSAVPETTQVSVLLASSAPLVLLAWPRPLASLGAAGAFAAAGLLAWTIAAGGVARPPSVAGGLACLGLLAVEPVARALDPGHESALDVVPASWRRFSALAAHLAIVFVCARVAARAPTVILAGAIALGALGTAVGILLGAVRIRRRRATLVDQPSIES